MKRLVRALGGILSVTGLAVALYGGYLEAIDSTSIASIFCFWGGVLVAGLGMVLCRLIDPWELWRGF